MYDFIMSISELQKVLNQARDRLADRKIDKFVFFAHEPTTKKSDGKILRGMIDLDKERRILLNNARKD